MEKGTFTVTDRKTSWWDQYRGATIFYIGLFVVIVFGIIPWLLGWAKIVKTLIKIV